MNISISVLTANFNNGKFIADAIQSVLNQTFKDWELIIIDDASSDGSQIEIKRYLGDKRIRFFENDKNIGYIKTLQKMIDLARGEVIVILDGDDTLHDEALQKVSEVYLKNPDYGLVYTQCNYCDEKLNPVHIGFSGKIPEQKSNLHVNSINAMRTFKKDAYTETHGYDKECQNAEDVDLNLKLEEVTGVLFIDKVLYNYRVQSNSATHGFRNIRINRSSTALAKLNAYKRRLGTNIPNLDKGEISEVLFFGIINSFLAIRIILGVKLMLNLFFIHPFFGLDNKFYKHVVKKIIKIKKLKKQKNFLKI